MLTRPVRLNIGVLQLGQQRTGGVVLEVLEVDVLVEVINAVNSDEREDIGALIGHLHRLTSLGIATRVAVVLNVTLSAHELGVSLFKDGDLTGKAAHAHILNFDLGAVRIFGVDRREIRTGQSLNQTVTHDTGFGRVRIVAEVAVNRVARLAGHVNDIAFTRERGAFNLVAHVGPVKHQVGGLTADAYGVGGSCRPRTTRFLQVILRIQVVHDLPSIDRTAAHGEIEPAVLRNKAAAESTVAEDLIKHGEGVAAEFRMFLRKAVAAQSAVKERIGRNAFSGLLAGTRRTLIIDLIHRLELCGVAAAAGLRIHARHRAGVFARRLQMLCKTRVAGGAGNALMSAALMKITDITVAGHAHRGVDLLSS